MEMNKDSLTQHVVDTFNKIIKNEIGQPVKEIMKVLSKSQSQESSIPEISLLYSLLSDIYYNESKFEESFKAATKAYEIDPNRKEVLHSMMNIYLPRKNKGNKNNKHTNNTISNCSTSAKNIYANSEKAKQFAITLQNSFPNDIQALNMASTAYTALGMLDEAIRALVKAHEILVETELSLRRGSMSMSTVCSNDSIVSNDGSVDSFDSQPCKTSNSNLIINNKNNSYFAQNCGKSNYRQAIEETITKLFLTRYRECPDDDNFKIMKYLIELIEFKDNTLSSEEFKMAKDEVCERAEYLLEIEIKKRNFLLCHQVIESVTDKFDCVLNKKLISKIVNYYEATNQIDLGIEYLTQRIEKNETNSKQRSVLHQHRSILYKKLGMCDEATQDLNTSIQLSKLRDRDSNGSTILSSNITNMSVPDCDDMLAFDMAQVGVSETTKSSHGRRFSAPMASLTNLSNISNMTNMSNMSNISNISDIPNSADNNISNISNLTSLSTNLSNNLGISGMKYDVKEEDNDTEMSVRYPSLGTCPQVQEFERKDSENGNFVEDGECKEEISRIKKENDELEFQLGEMKNRLRHFQETNFQLCEEKGLLESRLADMSKTLENMQDKMKRMNERNETNAMNGHDGESDYVHCAPIECDADINNINNVNNVVVSMSIYKNLQSKHDSVKEQLQFFRDQWAESRTNCEKLHKERKNLQNIISDLRMELNTEKEQKRMFEKQLKIMKDANAKTKLRRRTQQLYTKNHENGGDSGSSSAEAGASEDSLKLDESCLEDTFTSEQELEEKMEKIKEECNELKLANDLNNEKLETIDAAMDDLPKPRLDGDCNCGCLNLLFLWFLMFITLIGLVYFMFIGYHMRERLELFDIFSKSEPFEALMIVLNELQFEVSQSLDAQYWMPYWNQLLKYCQNYYENTELRVMN